MCVKFCISSSDDYLCDEFGLFLLSYVYKHHVIVILSNKLWCTFVLDKTSTFEKLCKADHTLIWLGDDKYSEVKPLQVKRSNLVEWQHSIDHLHDKNKSNKNQRRVERATASVCTPKKCPNPLSPTPESTRSTRKCDSKVSIDYKQFHEMGTLEEKKRKLDKFLPMSSGPSETILEAQKQLLRTKEHSRKVVTQDYYRPRRTIVVSNTSQKTIKQEHAAPYSSTRIVKPEPGIFMTHRRNPQYLNRNWKYVHVSGSQYRQGGGKDCNSQSENENETDTEYNTLPDLLNMANQTLSSKSANTPTVNGQSDTMPIELISPPAIERHTEAPKPTPRSRTKNLGDLLCTLNFNQVPTSELTPVPRKVVTSRQEECRTRTSRIVSRSAVITVSSENSSPTIESPARFDSPRKVVTTELPQNALAIDTDQTSTPEHVSNLYTPMGKSTKGSTDNQNQLPEDIQASGTDSQSTPQSVVANPDATELETSSVLLQLGNSPNCFNANYDNSEVLPVDAAPLDDFT